jgi:hypothetical protein
MISSDMPVSAVTAHETGREPSEVRVANPYHYGTPVTGKQFAGREQEITALSRRMRDGINVVVTSPRRYGKTSLLARATADLVNHGAAVVSVNVLACRDLATFASRLATAAYRVKGGRWHRLRHAAAGFASRLRISPTVTFEGDAPRFAFSTSLAREDADAVIEDVYALLDELSPRRGAALVLDEFQAISDLGDHLPGLFKALADSHPGVSLVLAGSKQHLMSQLVADRGAPLYGLAERMALDVLPASVMEDYLRSRAQDGGRSMSAAAAARIVELAGPVPNDIQHLAYEAWGLAARAVTVEDVEAALAQVVAHEASLHADRFESLAPGQRRVVATLADAPTAEPYSAAFTRTVGLATGASVRRALEALVADELVVRRAGTYRVADPFFAAWLSQTL